jgi:GTP-binding protein Era
VNKQSSSGFVAVVGRPNVGKSTLINALVGRKVSIVTPKPQTTRHRIMGIRNVDDCQIIFVDTPGLHRDATKVLNRMMNRSAASALADADLLMFVSEAGRWTDEDDDVLQKVISSGIPAFAILNKIDKLSRRDALLEDIGLMSGRHAFSEIVHLSATRHDNLEELLKLIPGYLPESPPLFPDDMFSDRVERFRAAEVVR